MKVEATMKGFIHGSLKREGDKFECSEKEFSEKWMKKADGRGRKVKLESATADALNPSASSASS